MRAWRTRWRRECPFFLDKRVVEWAVAMLGSRKVVLVGGKPVGKRVLGEAFRGRLPTEVFARPKRGLEMPVEQPLAGPACSFRSLAT